MTYVYDLESNVNLPAEMIGNKAFGLLVLLKNKINVPIASVLDVKAFQYFLSAYKKESTKWNNTYLHFDWPLDLLKEIEEIFSRYQSRDLLPLAIRSSGIAEDKQNASYAGQLHTELHVSDFNHLLIAIRKCWQSSLSKNYKEYHLNITNTTSIPEMAIIIQQMINPLVSGVMFTAHPVLQDLSQLIIEAHEGLAKNVVDGEHNCERYIFDKVSKKFTYEPASENQNKPFLMPQDAIKLFDLGLKTQDIFKWPQDIEWSIAQKSNAKTIYFLQSRPITTLYFHRVDKIYGY